MKIKKLWLDLELREDVDDFFTLVYALENNFPVEVVSLNEPSLDELYLAKSVLAFFGRSDIPVLVLGGVRTYPEDKDVNPYLLTLCEKVSDSEYETFNNFMYEVDMSDMTVFCGGSMTMLACLVSTFKNDCFEAVIQGGFAGKKLVGEENTLNKFKNREKVPSWNLNLDLYSTISVLESDIKKRFVSKNICHDSYIDLKDVENIDSIFAEWLTGFFLYNIENTEKKYTNKCMHDLLALLTVVDKELVDFIPVDLKYEKDVEKKIVKWWSEENNASNISISKSFNKELFLKLATIEKL